MWLDTIPSASLRLTDLPSPDADERDLHAFALTFDGYTELGAERCGEIANEALAAWHTSGALPETLDVLRGCLFYEQRRWRHFGRPFDDETMAYARALIARMAELLDAP